MNLLKISLRIVKIKTLAVLGFTYWKKKPLQGGAFLN